LNRDLIINSTPNGVELALLEDQSLVELHREKYSNQFAVGDILVGKVKKIVPSLNAAFVDIGYGKDAFLHYTDLGPQILSLKKYAEQGLADKPISPLLRNFPIEPDIEKTGKMSEVLSRRDTILVQILKEPISTKGPRLRNRKVSENG